MLIIFNTMLVRVNKCKSMVNIRAKKCRYEEKYFCEDAPQYHVAVAGLLLGISLYRDTSFPVGKVDMIKMYPMTFDEFQEVPRINMVWDSIPVQLAKENKKFIFGALKKGARVSEFEIAIQWLLDAGLIYQIYRITTPSVPLKFYEEMSVFKLFVLDIGLMGAMADAPAESVIVADTLFKEYKGAFTELFVLTQLITEDLPIYYFSSNDSRVEIDLIVQKGATVVPIEVKAEENVHAKSLRTFIGKHPELKGLRLSMMPYQDQEWMENRPLYAVGNWV